MCNSIAQDVLACSANVYAQWETRQQWRERAVRATITTCWHTRAMTTDNTYTSHDTSHANMDVDNANNVNTVHNPTYRNVLRVTRRPMWRCTDESSGQIRSMSWRYMYLCGVRQTAGGSCEVTGGTANWQIVYFHSVIVMAKLFKWIVSGESIFQSSIIFCRTSFKMYL